jgi:hypothetical protein
LKTIFEILSADHAKHYASRGISLESVLKDFEFYAASGRPFFAKGSVIIIFKEAGEGVIEFHCFNGGTGKDLTDTVQEFLQGMSAMFDVAVTFYDNPRISEMMKYVTFETNVEKIDDGEDRTYMAQFFLKGKSWAQ